MLCFRYHHCYYYGSWDCYYCCYIFVIDNVIITLIIMIIIIIIIAMFISIISILTRSWHVTCIVDDTTTDRLLNWQEVVPAIRLSRDEFNCVVRLVLYISHSRHISLAWSMYQNIEWCFIVTLGRKRLRTIYRCHGNFYYSHCYEFNVVLFFDIIRVIIMIYSNVYNHHTCS